MKVDNGHLGDLLGRASVTLFSTSAKSLLTLITSVFIARTLGTENFGVYAFFIAALVPIRGVVDAGSSSAYFTFISEKPRSTIFHIGYTLWLCAQLLWVAVAVLLIQSFEILPTGEAGISGLTILLFVIFVHGQHGFWLAITHFFESKNLTSSSQYVGISIVLAQVLMLWCLDSLMVLNITNILGIQVVSYFLFILLSLAWATAKRPYSMVLGDLSSAQTGRYINKYISYCKPLLPYLILSALAVIYDRWLLQTYGGAEQQSYYAVALQLSAIILLISVSAQKVLWSFVARSQQINKETSLREFYLVFDLILLLCILLVGTVFWSASDLINTVYGVDYAEAGMVFMVLAIYAVFQGAGQLQAAFLYGSHGQKSLAIIGGWALILGAMLSTIIFFPQFNVNGSLVSGENLAFALAIKFLIMQVSSFLIFEYRIRGPESLARRISRISLFIFIVLVITYLSKMGSKWVLGEGVNSVLLSSVINILFATPVILITYKWFRAGRSIF